MGKVGGDVGTTGAKSKIKVSRFDLETGVKQMYIVDTKARDASGACPGLTFPLMTDDVIFVPEVYF